MVKGLRVYRLCSQGFKDLSWHKSRGIKLLSQCLRCQKQSSCSSTGPECSGRYASKLGWSWEPAQTDEKLPCVHLYSHACIHDIALHICIRVVLHCQCAAEQTDTQGRLSSAMTSCSIGNGWECPTSTGRLFEL